MDFRIRPIRNTETLRRSEEDSLVSVLRELTQVMKQTQQYFRESQKDKKQANDVLLQLKSCLDEKQRTFKTVEEEIRKIAQSTCSTLKQISEKFQKKKEQNAISQQQFREAPLKEVLKNTSQKLIDELQEIALAPIEARNVEINLVCKSLGEEKDLRVSQIKQYIGNMTKKIFSSSFNMFFKQKVDYDKIKSHCSENIIGNIIETVRSNKITTDQMIIIQKHLSDKVLPFLELSYPRSEEKQTSSKLAGLILEKDIFNENRFDILYNSPIKSMTWHGLQYIEKNDADKKASKQVMKLFNYIIGLPNQQIKDSQFQEGNQLTLYEKFEKDMKSCFGIVFNKRLSDFARSQNKKDFLFGDKEPKASSIEDLLNLIHSKLPIDSQTSEKEQHQFHEKVKSYTKMKIGRKISPNSQMYSQSEIQKGNLTIKDTSIRRVITKWIQALQQIFDNPAKSTIMRSNFLMLDDGTENVNQGLKQKKMLFQLIKKQEKFIENKFNQIKRNMYENLIESVDQKQAKAQLTKFCTSRQALVGQLSPIFSRACQNYLVEYLIQLINSLKRVQLFYSDPKNMFYINQRNQNFLLINLKLGDLMRCQVSSKQDQIISIYEFLVLLCDCNPSQFELVRVKNRFNGPNKDILINIWYHKTIMIQVQLAIKNESPFLECSDKFCHFIYELRRDILGPISELVSVWNKLSPKSEFFQKEYKLALKKSSFTLNLENKCTQESHSFYTYYGQILPFWCSNCKIFQANEQNKIVCKHCRKLICSMCTNTEKICKKFGKAVMQLSLSKVQKGLIVRGIEIKSETAKYFFFLEFMGKLCAFSFKYSQSQFYELEKKYEQSSSEEQNEIEFKEFLSKNFLVSHELPPIDKNALLSEIFIQFWQNELKRVNKKKITTFSIFFSSNPQLHTKKKSQTIQKIFDKPEVIKCTRHIEILNIQQNQLQSLQNISIFKNLRRINFNFNKIQNLSSLPHLQSLKILEATKNNIISLVGTPCLETLQKINLQYNKIQDIKGLPELKNLQYLSIRENKLSKLQGLPNFRILKTLNLTSNCLMSFLGLSKLENLKVLNAERNKISSLQDLPQLSSIQILNLSNNAIHSLKQLKMIPTLKKLYLSSNKLVTVSDLPVFSSLETLILDGNKLQSLNDFPQLPNLTMLSAQYNQIISLQGTPKLLKLEALILCHNNIQQLSGLPQFPRLTKLSLLFNKLKSLQTFPNLALIEKIFLRKNQLESLKGLPQLKFLRELSAEQNQIKSLSGLPQLPSLRKLNINSNKIESLQGAPSLQSLKQLTIQNNELKSLIGTPLLPSLQTLNLDKNKLESLSGLPQLNSLKYLQCKKNKIMSLEGTPKLLSLEMFELRENEVSSMEGIPQLPNLKYLILNKNKIEQSGEKIVEKFPALRFIHSVIV